MDLVPIPSILMLDRRALRSAMAALTDAIACALILGAIIAVTPAAAEDGEKASREVQSRWIIMPGRPSHAAPFEKGAIVMRQTLLPLGYETLGADALDAEGAKPLAPAETPLVQLIGGKGVVACVIGEPAHKALAYFWDGFSGGRSRLCLIDSDKDGRFEAFVHYKGLVSGLPSVNGRLPKTPHPLASPVAYTEHDRSSLPISYFLGIRYDGHAITGNPVFTTVFGHDGDVGTLDFAWPRGEDGTSKVQATGRVLLKGATLDVVSESGDTLWIATEKPLPVGLFGVTQIGKNYFY